MSKKLFEINESQNAPAIEGRYGHPLRVSKYVADHNNIRSVTNEEGKSHIEISEKHK